VADAKGAVGDGGDPRGTAAADKSRGDVCFAVNVQVRVPRAYHG
jgi:hypothetical protein